MIAFLTLCYCGLLWLIFGKLKLAVFNLRNKIISAIVGVVGILALVIAMNMYQPNSTAGTVSRFTVPIVPRVSGRVIDVAVEPNTPIEKGGVLFRIDPTPYQADVDRLEAMLAEAQQNVPQLEATWEAAQADRTRAEADRELADIDFKMVTTAFERGAATDIELARSRATLAAVTAVVDQTTAAEQRAKLAYESQIAGVNTTVARFRAELDRAKFNLDESVLYAPADGMAVQLFLQPGAVTTVMPGASVMTFVYDDPLVIRAIFRTNTMRHTKTGDPVEIAFEEHPGRVYTGSVYQVAPITGEGAMTPEGQLMTTTQLATSGQVIGVIKLDDAFHDLPLAAGTGCAIAIYTDRGKPIRIVRKVIIRIYSWMNYL